MACGLSRLNDLLALWSQATCRLVTGRSHRPRSTWPNQARLAFLAVTHRYKRTHCLWLEQLQIADSVLEIYQVQLSCTASISAILVLRPSRLGRFDWLSGPAVVARGSRKVVRGCLDDHGLTEIWTRTMIGVAAGFAGMLPGLRWLCIRVRVCTRPSTADATSSARAPRRVRINGKARGAVPPIGLTDGRRLLVSRGRASSGSARRGWRWSAGRAAAWRRSPGWTCPLPARWRS